MKISRNAAVLATAGLALAVAGCVSAPGGGGGFGPAPTAESRLDGQWTDPQGVGISTFNNGQFVTVDARTNAMLSQGSYQFRDARSIDIAMTSLARGTQMNVSCSLISPSQLSCQNAMGTSFTMTRRG